MADSPKKTAEQAAKQPTPNTPQQEAKEVAGQTPTPFVSAQPEVHATTTTSDGVDVAITAEAEVVPVHTTNPVNLGGIIDRDFVGKERSPVFAYAGSVSAQNTYDCDQCGCLVRESFIPAHERFHGLISGVLNYNGVQT